MSIRIIVDSTCDLPARYLEKVKIVPMTVSFGEKEYTDGVDIDKNEFYHMLIEGDVLPKTSQPAPTVFADVYDQVVAEGDSAIVITVTGALSGTYQSACIAAEDYPNIRVVDSANVAMGHGILAEHAIDLAEQGTMELDELADYLTAKRDDICLFAILDTLEYLQKGGRISRTAAWAGNLLNLKPAVTVSNGVIEIIGKIRGMKKGNAFISEQSVKAGIDYDLPIQLGYSGYEDTLLQNYIRDSRELWADKLDPLDSSQICSVIGTHAGPGAYAVAFFRKNKAE